MLFSKFWRYLKWEQKSLSYVQTPQIVALHAQNEFEQQTSVEVGVGRDCCTSGDRKVSTGLLLHGSENYWKTMKDHFAIKQLGEEDSYEVTYEFH